MKTIEPSPRHIAFMDDMKAALGNHTDLSGWEMLALASQFVGVILAFQDQRTVTPAMAMDLVMRNIEIGNAGAVEGLFEQGGTA